MSRRRCRCGSVSILDDSVVARRSACTAWGRWPVVAGPQSSTPPRSLSAGGRRASGDSDTGVPSGAQLLLGSPRRPGSPWCGRRLRSAAGLLRLWLGGARTSPPATAAEPRAAGLRDLVQRVGDRGAVPQFAAGAMRHLRSVGPAARGVLVGATCMWKIPARSQRGLGVHGSVLRDLDRYRQQLREMLAEARTVPTCTILLASLLRLVAVLETGPTLGLRANSYDPRFSQVPGGRGLAARCGKSAWR